MKRCIIEISEKNDLKLEIIGIGAVELMGLLEMAQLELIQQQTEKALADRKTANPGMNRKNGVPLSS